MITIEEFARLELRVGLVKAAERVPKSKKLVRLTVDIGETLSPPPGDGPSEVVCSMACPEEEGTCHVEEISPVALPRLRSIVAGIGKHYAPEELVGRLVVVAANLEPAILAGVPSEGMVLAASRGEGAEMELSLLTLDRPLAPGSGIR